MDREKAWNRIRDSIPGSFFNIVKAKKLEREIRLSRPVLKGQVNFTPYTDLEKLNRELADLDQLLQSERDFNKFKEEEFSKRWDLAYDRQKLLNEAMIQFVDYHEGCQKKVEKDMSRIKIILGDVQVKDREIRKLQKVRERLGELKDETEKRRDLCESFKDYMTRVVQSTGAEYTNAKDLIAKFQDLKRIRDDQYQQTTASLEKGAVAQALQREELELFQDEEVSYGVHKARLEDYNKQLDSYTGELNQRVLSVKNERQCKNLEIERSTTSIRSLYLNLSREMNQSAKLKETDTKGQLEFIGKFVGEMRKINEKVRESLKGGSEVVIIPTTFNPNRRKSCCAALRDTKKH